MSDKIFSYLFSIRTLVLAGKITEESVTKLIEKVFELQIESAKEPVTLLINSGGGNIIVSFKLCDMLDYVFTVPVHGLVIGDCSSSATLILLSCKKKLCLPHSEFLIHSNSIADVTSSTESDMLDLANDLKSTREKMIEFYMKKLNCSYGDIQNFIKRGDKKFNRHLSAEEAKSIGLIDEIITENINIFSSSV